MSVLRNLGPRPAPVAASDPVTHAVMAAADRTGLGESWISKRSGISRSQLGSWRAGRNSANAKSLSYILEAIGADFVIVDRNEPPAAPIRLLSLNAIRRAVGRG